MLGAYYMTRERKFSKGEGRVFASPGEVLVAYDAEEAARIIGRPSREIEAILGYPGRAEMVHRDDMALSFAADPGRLSAAG